MAIDANQYGSDPYAAYAAYLKAGGVHPELGTAYASMPYSVDQIAQFIRADGDFQALADNWWGDNGGAAQYNPNEGVTASPTRPMYGGGSEDAFNQFSESASDYNNAVQMLPEGYGFVGGGNAALNAGAEIQQYTAADGNTYRITSNDNYAQPSNSFGDSIADLIGSVAPIALPGMIVPGFGLMGALGETEWGAALADATKFAGQGLSPQEITQLMQASESYNVAPEVLSTIVDVASAAAPVVGAASSAYSSVMDPIKSAFGSVADTVKTGLNSIMPEYVDPMEAARMAVTNSTPSVANGWKYVDGSWEEDWSKLADTTPETSWEGSQVADAENYVDPNPQQTYYPSRRGLGGGDTTSSYDPDAASIADQMAQETALPDNYWNMTADAGVPVSDVPPVNAGSMAELPMASPPTVDAFPEYPTAPDPMPAELPMAYPPIADQFPEYPSTPAPLPMATPPAVDAYPSYPEPAPADLPMAAPPTVDQFPAYPETLPPADLAPADLPPASPPTVDQFPEYPTTPTLPAELPPASPPTVDAYPEYPAMPAELPMAAPPTVDAYPEYPTVPPAELPMAAPPTVDNFPAAPAAGVGLPAAVTDIAKQLAGGVAIGAVTDAIAGGGNSAVDPSADMAAAEEARQAAKRNAASKIKGAFAGFDDEYYRGVAKSYKDFQNPLLDEQYGEAARKLPLRFARTDNSAFARNRSNLTRDYSRAQTDVANQAEDVANNQRRAVEGSRSSLLQQAEMGAGLDDAADLSAQAARSVAAPQAFSPIADMFGKYTANMANATLAKNYGYNNQSAGSRPLLFNPSRRSYSVTY